VDLGRDCAGLAIRVSDGLGAPTKLRWFDVVILRLAIAAVRLMMRGIPFEV
jgi:hypothetical protein